jgi:murein DD-endopeptidase MepM/ murein hydrolase activator NlpD
VPVTRHAYRVPQRRPRLGLPRLGVRRLGRRLRIPRRGRDLTFAIVAATGVLVAPGIGGPVGPPSSDVEGVVATPAVDPSARRSVPVPVEPLARPDPRIEPIVPAPDAPETLTGYVWPLPKGRLTLPFGPSPWGSRIVDGERFHDGIDLATACGDRIVAAHDGVVLAAGRRFDGFMGWKGDLAPYVERLDTKGLWGSLPIVAVIDDGNGYRSIYAHFRRVVVEPGDRVVADQLLGDEGATGRASGCHLHYGLFSPLEARAFAIDPAVVERMLVPTHQVARIDPLRVLPWRPDPRASPSPPRSGP